LLATPQAELEHYLSADVKMCTCIYSYIPGVKVLSGKLVGHIETPGQWHTCAQMPAHSALAQSPGA